MSPGQGAKVTGRVSGTEPPGRGSQAQGAPPVVLRPSVNDDNAYFWDGVQLGELRIQRCEDCTRLRHPSCPACPFCGSLDWDSVAAAGRGILHSYAVVHHPLLPPFTEPYPVAVVELAEGVRLITRLIGFEPEELRIGAAVRVRFDEVAEGLVLPVFEPTRDEGEGS
jgi:uncharacterized OB-fold protein